MNANQPRIAYTVRDPATGADVLMYRSFNGSIWSTAQTADGTSGRISAVASVSKAHLPNRVREQRRPSPCDVRRRLMDALDLVLSTDVDGPVSRLRPPGAGQLLRPRDRSAASGGADGRRRRSSDPAGDLDAVQQRHPFRRDHHAADDRGCRRTSRWRCMTSAAARRAA